MSYEYRISAQNRVTGEQVPVEIRAYPEGAIVYNEYRTGPTPWWKRALRRLSFGRR